MTAPDMHGNSDATQEAIEEATEADRNALTRDVPGRDGGPQDDDAMRAAEGLQPDPEAASSYQDMLERGAEQKGEGRVP